MKNLIVNYGGLEDVTTLSQRDFLKKVQGLWRYYRGIFQEPHLWRDVKRDAVSYWLRYHPEIAIFFC